MTIVDRFSQHLDCQEKTASLPELHPLEPAEIRLIADAHTERLAGLVSSRRLHAADQKGDTPLHLAARMGNLALCDLFIRSGADPQARNHERQMPADVAFAEGHSLAGRLLASLVGKMNTDTSHEAAGDLPHRQGAVIGEQAEPLPLAKSRPKPSDHQMQFSESLTFEPEQDPEQFFDRSAHVSAVGTFVALVTQSATDFTAGEVDWEVDLSPVQIAGDGFGLNAATFDHGGEHDFLKVQKRGRQSVKRPVVQSGTRLSIDQDICLTWTTEILQKRWFSSDDLDTLISFCEGNGASHELRDNLLRTLEAAGLELFDGEGECDDSLWDIRSEISADELAEAIEAGFTRATRLPGTRRFDMDKSSEARLLDPMVRAKQELHLSILTSEPAVKGITGAIDKVLDGSWKPALVTMRSIMPSRPESPETVAFSTAGQVLRNWNAAGRVMDGRRRREALHALEALDLSISFQSAVVKVLAAHPSHVGAAAELAGLISDYERSMERLIIEHLPYARRFAARNVEDGEDPEEVFQVAFLGLHRSARSFDLERGHRFVIYSTFWMKQFLTRWRADEGTLIRIPVHRHDKLAELARATARLDAGSGRSPSDEELAVELNWPVEVVRFIVRIRRQSFDLRSLDEWEGAIFEPNQEDALHEAEAAQIVSETLAKLPDRQAEVIRMRFGIGRNGDEMTLEEIGQIYKVTRERIRQIEAKGLKELKGLSRRPLMWALRGF